MNNYFFHWKSFILSLLKKCIEIAIIVEQLLFYPNFNKTDIFILVGYDLIIIRSETIKDIFKCLVENLK